jgi:type III restriction enzyme
MARLRQWCADATTADGALKPPVRYDFVFVDQEGFEKHPPATFAGLAAAFTEYKAPA